MNLESNSYFSCRAQKILDENIEPDLEKKKINEAKKKKRGGKKKGEKKRGWGSWPELCYEGTKESKIFNGEYNDNYNGEYDNLLAYSFAPHLCSFDLIWLSYYASAPDEFLEIWSDSFSPRLSTRSNLTEYLMSWTSWTISVVGCWVLCDVVSHSDVPRGHLNYVYYLNNLHTIFARFSKVLIPKQVTEQNSLTVCIFQFIFSSFNSLNITLSLQRSYTS